jgi:hypothetical protein
MKALVQLYHSVASDPLHRNVIETLHDLSLEKGWQNKPVRMVDRINLAQSQMLQDIVEELEEDYGVDVDSLGLTSISVRSLKSMDGISEKMLREIAKFGDMHLILRDDLVQAISQFCEGQGLGKAKETSYSYSSGLLTLNVLKVPKKVDAEFQNLFIRALTEYLIKHVPSAANMLKSGTLIKAAIEDQGTLKISWSPKSVELV